MKQLLSVAMISFLLSAASLAQNPSGVIEGTVLDENSRPLKNANVAIVNSGYGTSTDQNGKFAIANVPVGRHSLEVTFIGYQSLQQEIDVQAGQITTNTYTLTRSVLEIGASEVTASKSRIVSVSKLDVSIRETPITAQTINAELIEQRAAEDIGAAVKNITGVRPINRYGGFQTFRIRGFNNFVLLNDEVRDERHNISTSAPSSNLANIERVEVVKGPASVLYGHSALGGIINLVRKEPTLDTRYNYSVSSGSYNTVRTQAGAGGPITDKLRYRVDFGTTRADGFRDFGTKTQNGSLTLHYTPNASDRLELSIGGNNDLYDTDTGIPVLEDGSFPTQMDVTTRFNDPADFLGHERFDTQLKYQRQMSENMQLSNRLSYYDDDIDYLSTEFLKYNATLDSLTRGFPFYFNHETKPLQNQLELSYHFNAGNTSNKLLVGYGLSILDRKTYRGDISGEGKFATVSVVAPVLNQGDIQHVDTRFQGKEETVHALYVQNWLNLSSQFKALLGFRIDKFEGTYFTDLVDTDRNITERGERTKVPATTPTFRGGLVYQLSEPVSFYGSYSTYFKPSRRITGDGEIFDPENGYQSELGLRAEGKWFSLNLSTFYLLKQDLVESLGGGVYERIGAADSKGVEIDFQAAPVNGMHMNAGYAYTDAQYKGFDSSDQTNPNAGNRVRYAPKHLLNFWAQYDVPVENLRGLGLGLGMNHVGENFTARNNTYALPAYTLVDAVVFYRFRQVQVQFNINNLFDETHFTDAIFGNQFFPGKTRNFLLTFSYSGRL
ncbi:MAG: TonB-dependent receptor [Gemmatimonadota bacterium]|nr:TonB-dependent receptor [Gemmatimonadota bacterium]